MGEREASSAASHRSHYYLNNTHPPAPTSVEKLSSKKPVPGAKTAGDCYLKTPHSQWELHSFNPQKICSVEVYIHMNNKISRTHNLYLTLSKTVN